MGNLNFNEDNFNASINNDQKFGLLENLVLKIGLAKDKDGARKALLIIASVLFVIAMLLFYSMMTSSNRKPVTNEEISPPLVEQQS